MNFLNDRIISHFGGIIMRLTNYLFLISARNQTQGGFWLCVGH